MKGEQAKPQRYLRAAIEAQLLVMWTGDTRVLTIQYLRLMIEIDELEDALNSAECAAETRRIKRRIAALKDVCAAWNDVLSGSIRGRA